MKNLIGITINIIIAIFMIPLSGCSHKEKDYPLEISSQLQNVSRLELARMTVGKVGMISDPEYKDAKSIEAKASALLNRMKIGTRLGAYS